MRIREDGWVYEHDRANKVRWLLGRPGKRNLCCFGVNPSTASPERLDPTVRSVASIAHKKGFDGWVMFNLYPQRATNPNDLHKDWNSKVHMDNMSHIRDALKELPDSTLWAAWGTLVKKRGYLVSCLQDIYEATKPSRWFTMGKRSKAGHPHHPLYLGHDYEFELFDVSTYIREL